MERLFTPWNLKGKEIKNRVCVPPMVCFGWSNEAGLVSDRHVEHYRAIAKGGAGLIIQEATCVDPDGRLSLDQLGIWEDSQVEGLKRIVDAVHENGVPILVQIHHAGVIAAVENRVCPSDYTCVHKEIEKHGRMLSVEEIHRTEKAFIDGAVRAHQAGYDGVEVHGCHSYLISQFLNRQVNRRTDEYSAESKRFLKNILDGIRKAVPSDFIVGIRLGAFEPELCDGVAHAKWLEEQGIDFINVSYGFDFEAKREKPDDYPYAEAIYGAEQIKKEVSVPVFAVFGIRDGETADRVLLDTGVDMVNIGRGILVNYDWAKDVMEGKDPGKCLECPTCMWRVDSERCAGRRLLSSRLNKGREKETEKN